MADVDNIQVVLDAFNAHDLDRIMSCFSEDCVLETPRGQDPWGTRHTGQAAVRRAFAERFAGIPDVHYGDDETWVCEGHAVTTWLLTGTTTAGDAVRLRGCDLFDLTPEGKIQRKDSYWKIVS